MITVRRGLAVLMFLAGCASGLPMHLDAERLMGDAPLDGPVVMHAFAPGADARPADAVFSGRLVSPDTGEANVTIEHDEFGLAGSGALRPAMPDFDFAFVQAGKRLLPIRRGPIVVEGSPWEVQLEPGATWREPGDGGWNRTAIPFALRERNADCTHNGVLAFLYDDEGGVSRLVYQVSSQTCRYLKFTMWGTREASYLPGEVEDAARVIAAWQAERNSRLDTRPIESLARDYPGARPDRFADADEVDPADLTTYGYVIDDVHYTGGCPTRHGPYPYCDVMSLPSYSLAKSLFAGLALARAEKLYPGISRETIGSLVPACAGTGSWNDVTIANTLDMATGHYGSTDVEADEDAMVVSDFFIAEDAATKTQAACTAWPRREPPGTRWVYHTSDIYLAGVALRETIRRRGGRDVDLYRELVVEPLWRPLGLSPRSDATRRTYDDVAQPFFGWGLAFYRDDLARIARFLMGADERLDPQAVLDPELLRASLQQDPADRGLDADIPGMKYRNGFRGLDVAPYLGCDEPTWVSVLSGFGGIILILMPNETAYYYVSDGGDFRWMAAARESDRIRPYCTRATDEGNDA